MNVRELKKSLDGVRGDAYVVYSANPGPGAVAKAIAAVMQTEIDVIDNGVTRRAKVVVLVGGA